MTIHEKLAELIQQARAEGRTVERYRANGESYAFITRPDGWIQIVNVTDPGSYRPEIEARDRAHAVSYCELLEPLRVPVAELVPSREEGTRRSCGPIWRHERPNVLTLYRQMTDNGPTFGHKIK